MKREIVRTEIVESEESKQLQSDTNKMVNCLNKMFCDEMMPYYAEKDGHGFFEIRRTITNVECKFSFEL